MISKASTDVVADILLLHYVVSPSDFTPSSPVDRVRASLNTVVGAQTLPDPVLSRGRASSDQWPERSESKVASDNTYGQLD